MEGLCTACLCTGRKLRYPTDEPNEVYHNILSEISVYESPVPPRVCWECLALLRRFYTFKSQVKHAYFLLLQYSQELVPPDISTISRAPHLRSQLQCSVYCSQADDFTAVKNEYVHVSLTEEYDSTGDDKNEAKCPLGSYTEELSADVKKECIEITDIEHNEPETFVLDHSVSENKELKPKKKKKVKTKKKNKEVKLKKVKSKKVLVTEEEPPSDVESTGGFDDPDFDFNEEDNIDNKEDTEEEITEKVVETRRKKRETRVKTSEEVLTGEEIQAETTEKVVKPTRKKREKRVKPSEEVLTGEEIKAETTKVVKTTRKKREIKVKPPEEVLGEEIERERQELTQTRPTCAECGKVFSSKKTYRYHMNVLHKGQNRFPCPQCGKVYQWKSNLWRHIKNHKARDSGELYCAPCDRKFSSVATYRQHVRVSLRHVTENEFTYVCSECGRKFSNNTKLQDHVDWEHRHRVKYRCAACDKPFKSGTSLYVHLQNVHRNKQDKDNLCHVCGKSYQSSAKLRYHIVAMHSGETPYACAHCGAAFSWYSSLYRHVREVHDKTKVSKKGKRAKKTEDVLSSLSAMPAVGPAQSC